MRGGRSFDEVLARIRSTITASDFSDPAIGATILMLRELSVVETGKLIWSLDEEPLAGVSPPRREMIRKLLLEHWGRLDHAMAINYLSEKSFDYDLGKATEAILRGWAQADPAAALEYIREFGKTLAGGQKTSRSAIYESYRQWALQDVGAVLESLSRGDETEQLAALAGVGGLVRLPERREQVLRLIEEMRDEKQRGEAAQCAVSSLEPAVAARWIEGLEGFSPDSRTKIRESLTVRWGQSDPRAAGDWLLETALESERKKIIKDVVGWWVMKDTNAAAEWVAEIGIGQETDGAVERLVYGFSQIDPQAGFAWAQRITSRDERVRALADTLGTIHEKNPESANHQLIKAGIGADDRAAVLERLKGRNDGEQGISDDELF